MIKIYTKYIPFDLIFEYIHGNDPHSSHVSTKVRLSSHVFLIIWMNEQFASKTCVLWRLQNMVLTGMLIYHSKNYDFDLLFK